MASTRKTILGIVFAAFVGALVLYATGVLRFTLDGSGWWPLLSSGPDFDALEADRARQRALPPLPSPDPSAEASRGALVTPAAPSPGGEPATSTDSPPPTASAPPRGYWPDFRGPGRDGRYEEGPIRTEWPADGLPQLWRQPVGVGYASFVVANGHAFTIEQRRAQEVVAAYDVNSGRELWTNAWDGAFAESMGGDGPRATPTYHEGRVYALGALGELRCLDARTGGVLWRLDILADNNASNLSWGMSAAPLIVDDKVIVLPGGSAGKSVVAYHKATGAKVWSALDDEQAYTSPMLVTLAGVRQVIVVTATRAVGLTVDEGRLLWEHPWATFNGINAAQPLLLGNDRVFLSASYGHGALVFEVARNGEGLETRKIWENLRMKNRFTSSVLHRGHIYGLDESILAAVDAATGDLKWKAGRYGYGQILLAGDHIVVLAENGDLALVRASPERHEELARFSAISGKTWNHPVIADGRLLVRNLREMAAFDIRPR